MKVLLVAYHFPPDGAVGALRPGRVARALARRSHEVHVLAGPGKPGPGGEDAGVRVERLRPWFDPRALWAAFRFRSPGSDPDAGTAGTEAAWAPPDHVPAWKRHVGAALWLPDDRQGWAAAVIRRGRAIDAGGVDVVYTTAPPFSALMAGLMLRRRLPEARWIAEFRDPWTDSPFKPEFVRTGWSDAAERWLEGACLRHADRVVCVTEAAAAKIRSRLGAAGEKVIVVRNGIEETPAGMPRPAGGGRILYVGNVYHARDPRPFLDALASLAGSGRLPPGVTADFVGECSYYRGIDLRAYSERLGLSSRVNFRPPVPHEECLAMMQESSALLLLAQNQPLQVPNKLYEYLGARRPILAFADAEGETAAMLARAGGHRVVTTETPELVEQAILGVLSDSAQGGGNYSDLADWSTESQLGRLVDEIEQLGPPRAERERLGILGPYSPPDAGTFSGSEPPGGPGASLSNGARWPAR